VAKKYIVAVLGAILPLSASCALARDYPVKPIRFLVPYSPGGGTDILARRLAQNLTDRLGEPVIVDNRGGANGIIGMQIAAKAPPDGYTIVLALTAQLAINPSFYPNLPYDPLRDYMPITLLGGAPYLLSVHPSVQATSVEELIALAKSKPGGLAFGSSGKGGIPHLAGEMLDGMAGITMLHVPFKGGGPALTNLIAGQVQLLFTVIPPALPHVRAGRLRAIAVTGSQRSRILEKVPTIAETLPGYEASTWFGVLAPAHTQEAIAGRLNRAFLEVLGIRELRSALLAEGFEPAGSNPAQFRDHIRNEIARWAKVIHSSGARAD